MTESSDAVPESPAAKLSKAKAKEIADKYFRDGEQACVTESGEKALTAKEALFIEEYLVDLNASAAAIRAGYSKKTAAQIGYENLRKPHIAKIIQARLKERLRATKWTAEALLQRLGDELTADIGDLYQDDGTILHPREWPLEFRTGLVTGIEVEERYDFNGDDLASGRIGGARVVIKKVKLADRHKLKEMIGKHIDVGAFKERVEHGVSEPLRELYEQIAGRRIGPSAESLPGVTPPGLASIRPREPDDRGDT